ncbi:hypothetical protein RND71_037585 [Anisodus tanguticus]|uniref:Pentatricopeptide repeat-containing protein n=1 Tax=Anisodus tanguticus TaxID=243964 RepID=A0AAE1UYB9_9SOLA|nr:hypothetical protein RND71_037585 [Anisodus tanguticus]
MIVIISLVYCFRITSSLLQLMGIRWPRILTPKQLSQIIQSQKNPLKALQIFDEAKCKYPTYRHNGPVYGTMINILGRSGRTNEMKRIINQMKEDSCECHDSIFVNVIRSYAQAGLTNEAIFLFKSLPEFNCIEWTRSLNTLLEILVEESKLESVYQLFLENSCGWEVKSRAHFLNLLMNVLCRMKRSDLALRIFQEMSYQNCYPNKESYRILMRGLCEEKRLNEATHLLYSMFWRISQKGSGEDVVVYRTLLEALCDNEEGQEAIQILDKVLRKGLKAPKRCYKLIDLIHWQNGADTEDMKVLINEALIKGIVPSSDSYRAMAVDFYAESKIDEGNKVLKEMHDRGFKPSVGIYEAKVAALFRDGQVDEAIMVIDCEMVQKNCVPNIRLYNAVIKGICHERKSTTAIMYLERMSRQVGCVPNYETYETLVDGLCKDGKYVDGKKVMDQMSVHSFWPRVGTLNSLIQGLCQLGDLHSAIMCLEDMISLALTPDIHVWQSLLDAICSENCMNEASFKTLEQLQTPYHSL